MKLKVSRFAYSYQSSDDEVRDYILRADDFARKTYGRDPYFTRLSQILDQARFLGWRLPHFGRDIPPEFTEIPLEGINHIFENQLKLLVDVAPVSQVTLTSERVVPVRMICGANPAGDLVWKLSLLADSSGNPYVEIQGKRHPVKTSGTKITCSKDTLNYSEQYLVDCFGGDSGGVWPMPFLPEFFVDKSIAYSFRPEDGVVEVVNIEEEKPLKVIAIERVPWYRNIEVDRSRMLPGPQAGAPKDVEDLVSGWDELEDNEFFEVDDEDDFYPDDRYDDDRYDDDLLDEEPPWDNYREPPLRPRAPSIVESSKPLPKAAPTPPPASSTPEPPTKPPKPIKTEPEVTYKIKVGRGRPRKAKTYEKAMSIVARNEKQGKKCEVYSSESPEAVYITGIGELT